MKKMAACALALVLALTACSSGNTSQNGGGSSQIPPDSGNVSGSQPGSQSSGDISGAQPEKLQTATLYIGMDGQIKEYPLEAAEEITPEALVAGISGLTGWNLDLAGEITDGKGGMTVMFAETSALFVGPPDPQKDEFRVFDAGQLDQTVLDSVQKTLQNWAVVPGVGDPDRVDITSATLMEGTWYWKI